MSNASGKYQRIRPVPLMPGFAARIDGVDLSAPLAVDTKAELRCALLEFDVLIFDPQPLAPERHIDLASAFGDVASGAFFPRKDGYPEIEIITFDEQHPPELNVWHSDVSWKPVPPTGTVIQIVELPTTGGNTVWSSGCKAFSALSAGFKDYLRGLTATHSWQGSLVQTALEAAGEEAVVNAVRRFKPATHPLVRQHPESGKDVLFVNEAFTRQIDHISFRESRAVLEFLREWMVQPEFIYSHKWAVDGIAVWDNRSTQHYAVADYWPHCRTVQRVTFQSQADLAAGQQPATQPRIAVSL
jgi:taurine dioxygenase